MDARGALRGYVAEFGPESQVGPESDLVGRVRPRMDIIIEGNERRWSTTQAREAAKRVIVLFRGEFVNAPTARVSKTYEARAQTSGS